MMEDLKAKSLLYNNFKTRKDREVAEREMTIRKCIDKRGT
jgi:predicted Holliday junction resolvase-like endonuclease